MSHHDCTSAGAAAAHTHKPGEHKLRQPGMGSQSVGYEYFYYFLRMGMTECKMLEVEIHTHWWAMVHDCDYSRTQ